LGGQGAHFKTSPPQFENWPQATAVHSVSLLRHPTSTSSDVATSTCVGNEIQPNLGYRKTMPFSFKWPYVAASSSFAFSINKKVKKYYVRHCIQINITTTNPITKNESKKPPKKGKAQKPQEIGKG